MASSFHPVKGNICEEHGCEAITDVTYPVTEKKKLCTNCATERELTAINGGLRLTCDKHRKDMDFYCKTHAVGYCSSCAHLYHQQSCDRVDLDDAISEYKTALNALKEKANEKIKLCQVYDDGIRKCRLDVDAHLKVIKNEIDSVIDGAIEEDKLREQQDVTKINQEIDDRNQKLREQIQRNEEERKKLVEQAHTHAENRRTPVEKKRRNLQNDIREIAAETEIEIVRFEQSCKDMTKATEIATRKLDEVLEDNINIVKDGQRLKTSVAEALMKPLGEDRVQHIIRTVSGVRFVKGAGREEQYNGRIDGFDGEWRPIGTIDVSLKSMCIVGRIDRGDECHVVLNTKAAVHRLSTSSRVMAINDVTRKLTHILDINTKEVRKVVPVSETSWVSSCGLLSSEKVVCGKYCKDAASNAIGCITVYDRKWNAINDVTIPRQKAKRSSTSMDVAVDQDGMIIAVEGGHSKIYVINPSGGNVDYVIGCRQKIVMRGVLSSGHIVAQPWPVDHRLLIINNGGSGGQTEIPYSGVIRNVCIDPLTDDLYVVTSDDGCKMCVIDQVMSGDVVVNRRVTSIPISIRLHDKDKHLMASRVMITSSGKMIVCDGDKIILFKKFFRFNI